DEIGEQADEVRPRCGDGPPGDGGVLWNEPFQGDLRQAIGEFILSVVKHAETELVPDLVAPPVDGPPRGDRGGQRAEPDPRAGGRRGEQGHEERDDYYRAGGPKQDGGHHEDRVAAERSARLAG